ncbi:MAG: TetR/AcrR family transcriptional regulator [Chlorobi bacterium]|nr:TetR/AcrR family transcriptional regulator [Chlorobiota bacterium]
MNYNKDTSNRILEAATREFEEKGYSGARMQSIADRAGINKALLHYYYKSKDMLFQIIIQKAFEVFIPRIVSVFEEETDLFTTIEKFTRSYIELYVQNPRVPGFITQEINNHPDRLVQLIQSTGANTETFKNKIKKSVKEGLIDDIEPEQLIVNIISLCLFPFVAKPIVTELIIQGTEKDFDKLIENRKTEVAKFIIKGIKKIN